jgi:ketosteroid isomerase-like protein
VSGRSAILDYFRGFFSDYPRNEFELSSAEVVVTGRWAFDRGTYRWKGVSRTGGSAVEDNGKYLVVLQREPDGKWKVARDMDNSDRLPSQATRGTP